LDVDADLALAGAADLAGREGASVARSFAKIFFSMTDVERGSLAETSRFATTGFGSWFCQRAESGRLNPERPMRPLPLMRQPLDISQKSNFFSYIKS
jgi:hypothetical protein